MRHVTVFAAAMVVAAGAALARSSDPGAMNGEALRAALTGRTIHINTPLGVLPVRFRADGTMWGFADSNLASYTGSLRDRGRWWIAANQLCQRWNRWLDRRSYCFRLHRRGRTVHWVRNDGLSGMATIRR